MTELGVADRPTGPRTWIAAAVVAIGGVAMTALFVPFTLAHGPTSYNEEREIVGWDMLAADADPARALVAYPDSQGALARDRRGGPVLAEHAGAWIDVPFIGLRLCDDVELPPGEPRSLGLWRRLSRWMGQTSPPRGVDLYRQIFSWKPDEQRLREAVRLYSNGVRVMVRN